MKRGFNMIQNANISNSKPNATLEDVVVAVINISDNQTDKKGKYWTASISDSNQNMNRITKYLSSRINCSLHLKMVEHLNNQHGVKLNKLKFNGDNAYIATSETIATPKVLSFAPLCTQITTIKNIESMTDGEYLSLTCKIIDVGLDETAFFNNGQKRVQKLKRTAIVADKTDSINMNIWENQFNLIEKDLSYIIKLAKVKIFNDDISITTTTHTICKSRSLFIKQSIQKTKIKLNLNDVNRNMFEFIADTLKVQALLERCSHPDLSRVDLVEQEDVLLALSSMNVLVNFNPTNMHINTIVLNNVENN
ncbi:unnamed protein product [Rotaria socialis]|uniref:Uncharacterized protein n=1 Tax=Rotaria socialis TaxID=392032 RepID=A0A818PTE2_9BILA|nr:unnamed protein product [Rotaria socialis]CAF4480167.1 unnamed protein product [Rotaria socialis]